MMCPELLWLTGTFFIPRGWTSCPQEALFKQDLSYLCSVTHRWPWGHLAPLPSQAPGIQAFPLQLPPTPPSTSHTASVPFAFYSRVRCQFTAALPSYRDTEESSPPLLSGSREGGGTHHACPGDELERWLHRESRGRAWWATLLPQREPHPGSHHSEGCSDLRGTIECHTHEKLFCKSSCEAPTKCFTSSSFYTDKGCMGFEVI